MLDSPKVSKVAGKGSTTDFPLVEKGYDPIYGARPLKRVIQKYIENPLSMKILKGEIPEGLRISAEAEGGKIVFKTL